MALPFVREVFADAEKIAAFSRVASHLKEGTGRIIIAGLTPTAQALILVLLQRAAGKPLTVVVPDNRAAEEMLPVLQGVCELTGASEAGAVVALPARDVLPFQNLSRHPDIQEARAASLRDSATGRAATALAAVR